MKTPLDRSIVIFLLVSLLPMARAAESPRVHERIDADWKFRRDPIQFRPRSTYKWTYQPASNATLESAVVPEERQTKPVQIGDDVFHGRRGTAWFFATLDRQSSDHAPTIHFDGVDDNAAVYLNGKLIGAHSGYDDPFDVHSDAAWNPSGPNELEVLIENTDGPGGLTGDVTVVRSAQENEHPIEAAPDFNDRSWRRVHLPHDYVVEGKFDPRADTGHGSLPTTTSWYRKTLTIQRSAAGKSIWVDFDGIYRDSKVWFNGHFLGEHESGYTGSRYDLTRYANVGGLNVLAVHVDPRKQEGWWYEGGGIYRHV